MTTAHAIEEDLARITAERDELRAAVIKLKIKARMAPDMREIVTELRVILEGIPKGTNASFHLADLLRRIDRESEGA